MSALQSPQSQSRVKAVHTLDWNISQTLFGAGNDAATQSSHFSASANDMVVFRHPRKIASCSAHGRSATPNVGALEGGSDSTAATGKDEGESLTIVAVGVKVVVPVAGALLVGIPVAIALLVGVPVAGALLTGVPVAGALLVGVPVAGALLTGVPVLTGVGAAVCALLSPTIKGAMIKQIRRMVEDSIYSFDNNWSYVTQTNESFCEMFCTFQPLEVNLPLTI